MQMYDYGGTFEREWCLDSIIAYIKVVGGSSGRECLLVGLDNGSVLKIFVDNTFPVQLVKVNFSIKCLDLSASKMKLAIVDQNNNCIVYNLKTKSFMFQESNAYSYVS